MESLQWLYNTLTSLKYQNLVLIYQDISLIINVNPQTKLSITPNNQVQLIINEFTLSFPLNYPELPPLISPKLDTPVLSGWAQIYSNQKSNDGIPPQQNRLLQLYISLIQYQQPKLPQLPQKPSSTISKATTNEKTSKQDMPPQLPANPIRTGLIKNLHATMNETNRKYLVNITRDILKNQNQLMESYRDLLETEKYVDNAIKCAEYSNPIIKDKLEKAIKVTDDIEHYVESDYNHDEKLVVLDNRSIKSAESKAILDTIHFTMVLFNTKKISLTESIMQIRRLSRKRAVTLIESADL